MWVYSLCIMNKLKSILLLFIVFLVTFIVVIAETTDEDNPPSPPQDKTDVTDPETIRRLKFALTRLRGLEFKNELKVGIKKKDELKEKLQEQPEKESLEEYEKIRKAFVKFGLIPMDLNLRQFMIDVLTEQIGGFYDPEQKELYIVPGGETQSNLESLGIPLNIIAIISTLHEMTHALQDQNFDLLTLPMDEMGNDDLATAVKSLVEGEATFLMWDYMFRQRGFDLVLFPDMSETTAPTPFSDRSLLDSAPIYIKEGLSFPYNKGLEFVKFIKARGGWEAINKIYSDLPASTEQIIHPEKYFSEDERDYPITITIPDTTKVLTSTQWSLLLENVMGEFNISLLKKQFFPTFTSKRMSEGWGGDKFILWEDQINKHSLLVWFTAWDTETDAREFFNAYKKLIPKKYSGTSTEFPNAILKDKEFSRVTWQLDRQTDPSSDTNKTLTKTNMVSIEQNGLDVLVIEDVPENLLGGLVQTIWTKVQREKLKEVKRVPLPQKKEEKKEKEEKSPEKPQEK